MKLFLIISLSIICGSVYADADTKSSAGDVIKRSANSLIIHQIKDESEISKLENEKKKTELLRDIAKAKEDCKKHGALCGIDAAAVPEVPVPPVAIETDKPSIELPVIPPKLVSIHGNRATIREFGRNNIVKIGRKTATGFKLISIRDNYIILKKGKKKLLLEMDWSPTPATPTITDPGLRQLTPPPF